MSSAGARLLKSPLRALPIDLISVIVLVGAAGRLLCIGETAFMEGLGFAHRAHFGFRDAVLFSPIVTGGMP